MASFLGTLLLGVLILCLAALITTGTVYVVKRAIYEIKLLDNKSKRM